MRKLVIEHIVNIDYAAVEGMLKEFLAGYLARSGGRGYVVGVSGGLDSATALALAARSVGADRVFALVMPDYNVTPYEDTADAVEFIEGLGVRHHVIDISKAVDAIKTLIPVYEDDEVDRVSLGNLRARIRMCILYYYANRLKYLVLGASDRSEYLIGYFTKYGDGAADVAPLTTLYKTQVRMFARHLGVPNKIVEKPSSPRLWPRHLAEEELGIGYEYIDLVLAAYLDLDMAEEEIPKVTGLDRAVVDKVLNMYRSSAHKRLGLAVPEPTVLNTIKTMIFSNFSGYTYR